MAFNRWDVVRVQFPFAERMAAKHRPGLVVSTPEFANIHGRCIIVMITTAKAGRRPDDIDVTDQEAGGLPEDCVIRVAAIAAVSDHLIDGRRGTVTAKDRRAVSGLLRRYLP